MAIFNCYISSPEGIPLLGIMPCHFWWNPAEIEKWNLQNLAKKSLFILVVVEVFLRVSGWNSHVPKKNSIYGDILRNFKVITIDIWLVVYLPLWKIWVRQLGLLFPIYGKITNVLNQQPDMAFITWGWGPGVTFLDITHGDNLHNLG